MSDAVKDRRGLMHVTLAPHSVKEIIEDQKEQGEIVNSITNRTGQQALVEYFVPLGGMQLNNTYLSSD